MPMALAGIAGQKNPLRVRLTCLFLYSRKMK